MVTVMIRGGVKGLAAGLAALIASIISIIALARLLRVHPSWVVLVFVSFLFVTGPVFAVTIYVLTKDKRAAIGPLLLSPAPLLGGAVSFVLVIMGTFTAVVVFVIVGGVVILAVLSLPARTPKGRIVVGISSAFGGAIIFIPGFILPGGEDLISYFGLPVFGAFYGAGWELARAVEDQVS